MGCGFLLNVVGACMAFVFLVKIAEYVKWNNKYFQAISKKTMPVYLFHQQIIYFFIYYLNGIVNPFVNATINFCGSMVLSLLIATLLMKFRITRLLIGEK